MEIRHLQVIADELKPTDRFNIPAKAKVEILDSGEVWLGLWSKRNIEFDGFVIGATLEAASRYLFALAFDKKRI